MDTFLQYSTNKSKAGLVHIRSLAMKSTPYYSYYKRKRRSICFIHNTAQTIIYQLINTNSQ